MKKIVGIIAAVAMAASVFAVDFTGAVNANSDLFNMSFASGSKPTILNESLGGGGFWWGTRMQTAIYGDKGGAQFAIQNGGNWDSAQLWIQPIDALKITMLGVGDKLYEGFGDLLTNYGVPCDSRYVAKLGGGLQFTLTPVDGLAINLTLGSPWISGGVIGDTGLSAKYTADFGTLGFLAIVKKGTAAVPAVAAAAGKTVYEFDPETGNAKPITIPAVTAKDAVAAKNFKEFSFAAGYNNKFGDLDMFANVGFDLNADDDTNDDSVLQTIKFGAQAAYAKDAFAVKGYAFYAADMVTAKAWGDLPDVAKKAIKDAGYKPAAVINTLQFAAEVSYQLDAFKPYLKVSTGDLLLQKDEAFDLQLKPGLSFNIGCVGCDLAADIRIAGGKDDKGKDRKGSISVPFSATVSF